MLYTLSCHGNKWSLPCFCTEGPRVLAEQEAARIRGQFSKGTDDPGGKHSLTLFIFSFSLSTPPRTCSFPPCLLQPLRTMWFPLWPLIFLLNHLCVCVRARSYMCIPTYFCRNSIWLQRLEFPS